MTDVPGIGTSASRPLAIIGTAPGGPRLASRYFGPPNTPHDVRRLRKANLDMSMRLGQPVVWRHQFTNDDLEDDYKLVLPLRSYDIPVQHCPACYNSYRGQGRADCQVCYGTTFASVEVVNDQWIDDDGEVVADDLGDDRRAPLWRGYGPAILTWIVEPDAAVDIFKLSDEGAIVQVQNAQGFAPWFPVMSDNDLIVNVDLALDGKTVERTIERFQLKLVNPISVRGIGKRSRGSEHMVAQTFEMARLPRDHVRITVGVDD